MDKIFLLVNYVTALLFESKNFLVWTLEWDMFLDTTRNIYEVFQIGISSMILYVSKRKKRILETYTGFDHQMADKIGCAVKGMRASL